MKHMLFLFPVITALILPSCEVPGAYPGATGVTSVGVSYGNYATLPPGYAGDAYYYGGRYYSGGRYERGRYYDHGRAYEDRYYHNGRYYYGGRHEHHDGDGHGPRGDGRGNMQYQPGDGRQPAWQSQRPGQPFRTGDGGREGGGVMDRRMPGALYRQ